MNKLSSFYNIDFKTVLENLEVTELGLSEEEADKRKKEYGENIFEEGKRLSLLNTFLTQFKSPLIFILIFASLITVYLEEVVETAVIWLAILINILFSTYQEYNAENTIEQLKKYVKNRALVKRGGVVREIEATDLTIGDIVILQYGARVPGDIRLIQVNDLKMDETILTGESLPIEKTIEVVTNDLIAERKNYAFCGTLVTSGSALGVVTHIGAETEIGKIAKSISSTKKVLTPVQNAVKKISWYIFIVALFIVVFIFILGIYRGENIFDMLVLASAVAVGAVPEAMPITLTVILAIGVLNISKKGGLIRKLSAAETLGSTTLILTDKTGTLTEGKLNLEKIIHFDDLNDEEVLKLASNNFSINNAFENILTKVLEERKLELKTADKIVLPFNSTNKYSVSLNDNRYIILGAPDILIQNSNLDNEKKSNSLQEINLLSGEGKRLVAVAEKSKNIDEDVDVRFELSNLELVGLFVFSDTLRKGIKREIQKMLEKQVQVKMLTGDLPGTAKFIGEQIGIVASEDEILTGNQLEHLKDEDLLMLLPKIKIFARVTPEDKLRIGKLYQKLGEVVAMTGDGVNDAPSLKAMDIGISLSSASEVAKSAADMILLKDNFKTVVDTISVGHNIKKNIQKVFVYLMSNSLDEVFVISGALVAGLSLPLSALQIIWVNILTGTLPALAFAYDKDHDIKNNSKIIFDSKVKFMALGIGTFSSLLLFLLYFYLVKNISDLEVAKSVFFLCFATYILVIAFSFKNLDKYIWQYNPFNNWKLNIGVLVGLFFIFLSVYTSLGRNIFELIFVPAGYLWILFVWLVINVWIIELTKFMFKKNK